MLPILELLDAMQPPSAAADALVAEALAGGGVAGAAVWVADGAVHCVRTIDCHAVGTPVLYRLASHDPVENAAAVLLITCRLAVWHLTSEAR
jgi:hypothetical protein